MKWLLYIVIGVLPGVILCVGNEWSRLSTTKSGYIKGRITAINTGGELPDQCSWSCHNYTAYCKKKHVKLAKPYLSTIDPLYSGTIKSLQATGDYALANIAFFVLLLPLIMYFLLVRIIHLEFAIRKLKR